MLLLLIWVSMCTKLFSGQGLPSCEGHGVRVEGCLGGWGWGGGSEFNRDFRSIAVVCSEEGLFTLSDCCSVRYSFKGRLPAV